MYAASNVATRASRSYFSKHGKGNNRANKGRIHLLIAFPRSWWWRRRRLLGTAVRWRRNTSLSQSPLWKCSQCCFTVSWGHGHACAFQCPLLLNGKSCSEGYGEGSSLHMSTLPSPESLPLLLYCEGQEGAQRKGSVLPLACLAVT